MHETIGILGAGKLGIVLAQLARKAGYEVLISGSGSPDEISLTTKVLAPGSIALTSEEVAKQAQMIILALPLSKYKNIPKQALVGKLVVDAMNYWWEVDGPRDDFLEPGQSSSEAVQQFLDGSRVVKAFSHMGYHDLFDEAMQRGESKRKAIALAGDDVSSVEKTSQLIDRMGFDPLYIGRLDKGVQLEPGSKSFGANLSKKELIQTLGLVL